MNIIKMTKIKPQKHLRKVGPFKLEVPTNLIGFDLILKRLKAVQFYLGEEMWYLKNKVNQNTNHISLIPAPTKRFINDLKFVFGENNLTYETTFFNLKEGTILFVYFLSYDLIEKGIFRLDLLKRFLIKYKIDPIKDFSAMEDDKDGKYKLQIKDFAITHDLKNFSHQKIMGFLSHQQYYLDDFYLNKANYVNTTTENNTELVFSSQNNLQKSIKILEEKRILIKQVLEDRLIINGNLQEVALPGFIKQISSDAKISFEERQGFKVKKEKIQKTNVDKDTINEYIGVIDGGLPESSKIIHNALDIYEDNLTLKNGIIPEGTHAEEVCSILLMANELSEKTKDKLAQPKVALFNVVYNGMGIVDYKSTIELILKKYYKKIKIWNTSINFELNNKLQISNLGVFFDNVQKKYDVQFCVSIGNNNKHLLAPSWSHLALSVSAYKKNYKVPSYIPKGNNFIQNSKPDTASFGGDEDDKIIVYSDNIKFKLRGGSSYAVPLVARLLSNIYSLKDNNKKLFNLRESVAILHAYSVWNGQENNLDSRVYPNGALPVDSSNLFKLIRNRIVTAFTIELEPNWSQGFMEFKMPQFEGGYDFNYVLSVNIDSNFENHDTFEYVLDSTKVKFGRVDPFKPKSLITDPTSFIINASDENFLNETMLRIYKGKYKSRYFINYNPKRNRAATKTSRLINETKHIENWGIKFERNWLNTSKKKRKKQEVSFAFIAESKNKNFYKAFVNLNKLYIEQTIDQSIDAIHDEELEFI